jgi:hypothetical protein
MLVRLAFLSCVFALSAVAAPPAALALAIEKLGAQKSYSWEVINSDPGPVRQQFQTRRGKITMIQQNTSPHLRGSVDLNGDMLIVREWADGLRLDTIVTSRGGVVTRTPEGWMTDREILSALAEEQLKASSATPRHVWLRRADRPDLNRPDQELVPLLRSTGEFEVSDDTYVTRGHVRPGASAGGNPEDAGPPVAVDLTINLSHGLIRDYEVKLEATRSVTRARVQVPVSAQKIVILTYLPVSRIDVPAEARAKLKELE